MPKKYASMRERLNANAVEILPHPDLPLPCRLWTGAVCSAGRPKMGVRSRFRDPKTGHRKTKTVSATRMSLADHLGLPLWRLNHALHKCDRLRCIEPTHLFSSTQKKNMQDMVAKGRARNGFSAPKDAGAEKQSKRPSKTPLRRAGASTRK